MEWRRSISFPDYEVSERGDVRSAWRVLKPRACRNGYLMVHVARDGKKYLRDVHRLVGEAFLGPKPFDGAMICHNDGSRTNNVPSNLRWDSWRGNHLDKLVHGTDRNGEKHPLARLTQSQVREIVSIYRKGGVYQRTLAKQYGVSQQHISEILRGNRWNGGVPCQSG